MTDWCYEYRSLQEDVDKFINEDMEELLKLHPELKTNYEEDPTDVDTWSPYSILWCDLQSMSNSLWHVWFYQDNPDEAYEEEWKSNYDEEVKEFERIKAEVNSLSESLTKVR